jgi:prevent-host-death family protein
MENPMKSIKASEFKAKCLKLMDQVAETGETLVITKNGRPVAELHPAKRRLESLFGAHKGLIEIKGDIVAPLDEDWEAER